MIQDLGWDIRLVEKPKHMSIDIETRSGAPIGDVGMYRYAQDPDFSILLFAYKLDDGPVYLLDLTKRERLPETILSLLRDSAVIKHAYNAAFEWYCLCRAGYETDISQWRCTMLHAMYCGFPAGLEATGSAIGLPSDKKKLNTGKALIRYFCTPQKATKKFSRKYHKPEDDPDRWVLFKEYCRQDVTAEYEILNRLKSFPVPDLEEQRWQRDVIRNAEGIAVDLQLVQGALSIEAECTAELLFCAKVLTGLVNPNSLTQLKSWITERTGRQVDRLTKESIPRMLEADIPDDVKEVLRIRQKMGKTSTKKYAAIQSAVCDDGRVRGLLQFYGAVRTGRWAGRLVQVQNLPRNYLGTLDVARDISKSGNTKGLELIYGNIPDTLSQLIRTAFVPKNGYKFIITDFSAIEARVIAWLAGEEWITDVFRQGGDIYCATASQMFGVPVEKHGKNADLRQKGKVATLALGYNGGPGALIAMGALDMGLREDELPDIVARWRGANPHIVQLWKRIERAAIATLEDASAHAVNGVVFRLEGDLLYEQAHLTVELPSKRKLYYPYPRLMEDRFGRQALHYYSLGTNRQWELTGTYGGKLTENIVQAIARDCLADAMDRMELDHGWRIVMHVHDEVVIEAPPYLTLSEVNAVMAEAVPWAPGLILKGDGFESTYYKKD